MSQLPAQLAGSRFPTRLEHSAGTVPICRLPQAPCTRPPKPPPDTERREQFRLTKLGLLNWGTVAGLHEVPIAPDGCLIVGRRGSGKSTLLDADTALLIPPRWTTRRGVGRRL